MGITEAIRDAEKVMKANGLTFATIWKTGELYGFNFDDKPVGYTYKENTVKRTVIKRIEMRYHVDTETRGRLTFKDLPKGTYFLSGVNGPEEEGLATYFTFDRGTCLIPIIETATGKQYRDKSRAGKEI